MIGKLNLTRRQIFSILFEKSLYLYGKSKAFYFHIQGVVLLEPLM